MKDESFIQMDESLDENLWVSETTLMINIRNNPIVIDINTK